MYRGRCIGRVIDFLSALCGEPWAHEVIFHMDEHRNEYLEYKGELFAKYTWFRDTDIPIFTFVNNGWNTKQTHFWIEARMDPYAHDDLLRVPPATKPLRDNDWGRVG